FDLLVALNPATYKKDVAEVRPGGWLLYDSTWPLAAELVREDVTLIGIPLAHMVNESFAGGRERILMKNIAYAGALAALLDMDMALIAELIQQTYGKKAALLASNEKALALGFDYVKKHFVCPLPIRLAKLDKTAGHILMDGNTAAALGCVYAGATVGAWYPITPATSLMEGFKGFCQQFRENPDGTKRYAILQAEDELSAFDVADRFQTPVFVLSDLDIGMNDWMVKELTWDDAYRPDRGKVFTAADLEKLQAFYRYLDVDGDGVAARTLPGTSAKGAYFTRGSGHNKLGGYTEDATEYVEVVDRIARKIDGAAEALPQPVARGKGQKLSIIT